MILLVCSSRIDIVRLPRYCPGKKFRSTFKWSFLGLIFMLNPILDVNALSDLAFIVKMAIFKMAAPKNLNLVKMVVETSLMAQMKGINL